MSSTRKKRTDRPAVRLKKAPRDKIPTFDDLVVDGALPRVKVMIFPSKGKGKNKPTNNLVVELQCEV